MIITIKKHNYTIEKLHSGKEILDRIVKARTSYFTYDLETSGLHVKADKPFVGGICFKNTVILFNTTYEILKWFPLWCKAVRWVINHNICFDLNMSANVIGVEEVLESNNFMDSQALVRLSTESVSDRRGGDSMKLKSLGKKYVDTNADHFEKLLKAELKRLDKVRDGMKKTYLKEVGWTVKRYKEAVQWEEVLPDEVVEVLEQWNKDFPAAKYSDVTEEILYPYLAVDVILVKELVEICAPIIKQHEQTEALMIENSIIPVVVRMAREGMGVDQEYLVESREKLKVYIQKLYEELWSLTGIKFRVGQHPTVKKYFQEKGFAVTDSESSTIKKTGLREGQIIAKLRTLEKWKSTYIEKIQRDSAFDGRFYSMLNPFNAISGRFSGDSQQFPKKPLKDEQGNVLYHPRRAFKGNWVFQDFSQVELRVAAHWTTFFGYDTNLCKSYMPYRCVHYKTGKPYDPLDYNMRDSWKEFREGYPTDKHWEDVLKEGWSVWIDYDTKEYWKPTDLHAATAINALSALHIKKEDLTPEQFKHWRGLGKRTNFLKLYGGSPKALMDAINKDAMTQAEEIDVEIAEALSLGFDMTFPKLKAYSAGVEKTMYKQGYAKNLYGRRYFLSDSYQFYTVANYLIQGSCAYDLKVKMVKIDRYIRENNLKTRMVLTVHDEIIFTKVPGEEAHMQKIVEIMEDSTLLRVPLVSECEVTDTYWSEKFKKVG